MNKRERQGQSSLPPCPHPDCRQSHVVRNGSHRGRQRSHCRPCKTYFGETQGTPMDGLKTPAAEVAQALFRAVLSQVLAPADGRGRRKISVVVDTSRMHFAKPVLAKFSAHPEQIELVTRPSSSPQLNPARRFWKHVRRKVTHTTFSRPLIDCLMRSLDFFVTWRLVHRPCARSPDEPRTSHQLLEIERTR